MNVLHASWQSHFDAFGSSDATNANMAMFSDAMDTEKSKIKKINDLVEVDDTVALIKDKDGNLRALHNFKKIGGTRIRPNMQIICLVGSNARATGIVVNADHITKSKEITIPTADVIWNCSTINELENVGSNPPRNDCSSVGSQGNFILREKPKSNDSNRHVDLQGIDVFYPTSFHRKTDFWGNPN